MLPRTLEELVEWSHNQRTVTRCAWCGASLDGTFEEGRTWHREHVEREHPAAVTGAGSALSGTTR